MASKFYIIIKVYIVNDSRKAQARLNILALKTTHSLISLNY